MNDATRVASVDNVPDVGSYLFTVRERDGSPEEVILVRSADCETATGDAVDGSTAVVGWKNFCQHETDQRLDRGRGAATRDGDIICPKHGSFFDSCSGYCDNGKAAESTLVPVSVTVDDDGVYLTDEDLTYLHDGGIEDGDGDDDDDGVPSSTSHLSF